MKILGIETSCDETSAAVVSGGKRILSNVISSQVDIHRRFGGVVPEIASRAHLESIESIVDIAIQSAGIRIADIDGVAVTRGPGLIGALLVGISFAEAFAESINKPLAGVNHLHAHVYANLLSEDSLKMPFIWLIVSGGHTLLGISRDIGEYELLGTTVDDAAGEAFDKVSKLLGLGYPGGPAIQKVAAGGNPLFINFPRAKVKRNPYFFSFSGLKTAVLYYIKENEKSGLDIPSIAASFQEAVVDVLVSRTIEASVKYGINRVVLGGGVACNSRLREKFSADCGKNSIELFIPPFDLCTDNAAMVAGLGFEIINRGLNAGFHADPNLKI
ncbi:MAG: tRNA (adenosine(37)-N6)-threonylcarbamoyltransferase complex transferase subunit TsaD [Candidatus Aureabacteria bacterium]|nr:tRNA (adenosine(37)-N6)-threonylcarbamoyltransferase complex transferase subunit TsaD [Candidatus Auribacterota bacterium]